MTILERVKTPMAGKINRADLLASEVDDLKTANGNLQIEIDRLQAEAKSSQQPVNDLLSKLTKELQEERTKNAALTKDLHDAHQIATCASPLKSPATRHLGSAIDESSDRLKYVVDSLQQELDKVLDFLISKKMLTSFLETQTQTKLDRNPNPLILAARTANRGCVAALLRLKDGPKYMARPDDTGRTALHYSCLEGQAGVVEEMMAKLTKKDVNQPDKEGMTPLMAACFMKQTDIVRMLLEHPGITVDGRDATGATALHWACSNGDVDTVAELVKAGAPVNKATDEGRTCFHAAAWAGHASCIETLFNGSTAPELQCDVLGATPLHFATYGGHAEAIKAIMANVADLDLGLTNKEGQGYGELACLSGNADAIKALLEGGMQLDAVDKEGKPLVLAAAHNGLTSAVQAFIEKGVDKHIKETNGAGLLHLAAHGGHFDCCKMLLANGFGTEAKDGEGFEPLHCAAQSGNRDTVKLLLDAGGNVNSVTGEGLLPCHVAACTGSEEVFTQLMECGADTMTRSKDGWLPLHFAAQWGHPKLVEMLLQVDGADINAMENVEGHTALHIAAAGGKKQCVTVLLAAGADKNLGDKTGSAAWQVAQANGNSNCAKMTAPEGAAMPTPPSSRGRAVRGGRTPSKPPSTGNKTEYAHRSSSRR